MKLEGFNEKGDGMNLFTISIIALCLTTGLTACSLKKTADNMENSTKNIEEYSRQLAERTEELMTGMRKVESQNVLTAAREALLASKGTTLKIQKATVFFAAFEFQEWTGKYTDTPEKLDELYSLAVKLFFTSVDDLIEDSLPVNPLKPNDTWMSVASLAVTMGYEDVKQKTSMEPYGFETVSMYKLITKALEMEPLVDQGIAVPKYVERVLEWKQEAIYMLQLRHNYFPAMVLARSTPFEESFLFQVKQNYWGSTQDLAKFSTPQLREWTGWLNEGLETQVELLKLGIALEFTDCIQSSFKNLHFTLNGIVPTTSQQKFLDRQKDYTLSYTQ